MGGEIEYTDEFGEWWESLTDGEQESVRASVKLLGDFGPKSFVSSFEWSHKVAA
jgi:hypothetical protein